MSTDSGRPNALDMKLDIQGANTQNQTMTLADEFLCLGLEVSGQSGSAASITTVSSGIATVTGLTGMTAASVGNILYVTGAASGANNGAFLISEYNSATSVGIVNSSAVASDANNGSIVWSEREAYSAEDNVNYSHTDRRLIKGTTNWYDDVPTYQRPTAIGTSVPANLTNIAGKTTDAQGFITPCGFRSATVADTDGYITITSVGNLKHSDAVDKTGIPCYDVAPYVGDDNACYVLITDPVTDNQLTVSGGVQDGYVIFGLTRAGNATSPDEVEIQFMAVPHGSDISNGTAFTWDTAYLPTSIDVTYGCFNRLDQMDEYSFRRLTILGVTSDADLRTDVNDLQSTMGVPDGSTSLASYLTNTIDYYAFTDLPDATPSVLEALNTLNNQIGDRTYTGSVLTSGETIAASLQALSSAIGSSSITRIIERLTSEITAFTAHTLPGGATYTPDGLDNGANLFIYVRGLLKDPGLVSQNNDYEETSTTQVTFYQKVKDKDHINYFILQ